MLEALFPMLVPEDAGRWFAAGFVVMQEPTFASLLPRYR